MLTLGYFSDTHLRASTPSCRKDKEFYANQLEKLREALNILDVHDAFAVHGGDLTHVSNSPLSLIYDAIPILKDYAESGGRCPNGSMLVNPGNHDFFGSSQETIRRSGLGILDKADAVGFLEDGREIPKAGWSVKFKSAPYMISYPEDFYWIPDRKDDEVWVVVAHDMLTTRPVPFPHRQVSEVRTNADIVLCSHWHSQFMTRVGRTWFVNSGPLDVQAVDQRNVKPAVVVVGVEGPGKVSPEFKFLKHTGYEEVEVLDEQERDLGLADDFARMVRSANLADGADYHQAILQVAKEAGYSDACVDRVLSRIRQAQTCHG